MSQLRSADDAYNFGETTFNHSVAADARATNILAVRNDAHTFRNVVYSYDQIIRRIKVPPAVQTDFNKILELNKTVIAELDRMSAGQTFPVITRAYKQFKVDDQAQAQAVKKVLAEL